MGIQTAPGYLALDTLGANFQHPVELMRNLSKALAGRGGITRNGDYEVTSPASGMVVAVAKGTAFLQGTGTSQGSYFVWSDAAENLAIGAASGSPRYDSLILRVADPQYGTITGSARAYWEVVQGAPAGSPVPRADSYFNSGGGAYQPGAWLRVADVLVNPGDTFIPASGRITMNRSYVRNAGGTLLCVSTARPTDVLAGDRAYEIDTKTLIWHNGTEWKLQPRIIGTATNTGTVTWTSTEIDVPAAAITGKTVRAGRTYRITIQIKGNSSIGTTSWNTIIRKGAALSGTIIQQATSYWPGAGFDDSRTFSLLWDCVADDTAAAFRLSVAKVAGSGALQVYAGTTVEIEEIRFTAETT